MNHIKKLLEVMATLRDPEQGCPWDIEQDFRSIAPYTIEEAYEVADAIARDDLPGLKDELGDLLLQVVYHARMAEEAAEFDFDDVAACIVAKMIRRHPHVFGDEDQRAAGMIAKNWERIKSEERADDGDGSALAGVALGLPALKRAQKLGQRASAVGFDWPDDREVRDKVLEELEELEVALGRRNESEITEEFGDLLFALVNLARHLSVDPEQALMAANSKFERRFRAMEQSLAESGVPLAELSLQRLEQAWCTAKRGNGS
jgi:nucleoside triphosphate diphosphatase